MTNVLYDRSSTLSLWRTDPYWKSQLLVDYSKDLFTCMILDDQLLEEGYSVKDQVIYYHGRIFLSRSSKLKEKLLHVEHEYFLFNHTYSMRAYHTILEGYTWEGFEEEIYNHFRRCMDHMDMEEIHKYLMELSKTPLFSMGMRGDLPMDHSICVKKAYGKDNVCMHNDLLNEYFHSFTIHVQAIDPNGSILPYKIHGQLGAIKCVEHGYSLGGYREMIYHSECTPKAPNITHLLKTCENNMEASKWWGNHLPYHYLRKSGDKLRWFHMWDYDPPPLLHMEDYIYLVLIPYIDDVLIHFMGMIGGGMKVLDVPFWRYIVHVSYASCFRENIGKTMIASLGLLLPCGTSHFHLMRTVREENFMEGLIGRHLVYEERLSHGGVTK